MPRLTVIMPAHNAEATIVRAVGSTLSDLPGDAELHVLDDASTDGTLDILDRVASSDKRLRVSVASSNQGVAKTLNALLATATGEYVARMDADDVVIPGRFRSALSALEHNTADVVFGGLVHLGPGRRLRPAAQFPISPVAMPYFLLLINPVTHSTMVGRLSVLAETGGYREVPSEDYDLWLRMAARGYRLRRLARPGVMYRHHLEQVTAGAEWIAAARSNPVTAHAHSRLSQMVLGADHQVFEELRRPVVTDKEAEKLLGFLADLRKKAGRLTLCERLDLSRLCRKVGSARLGREVHHVG
ncbi:glycosyltransferase family 2 protein [Arthrobacter sp. TB 23]|uniref:glycosyltransferase family 2 protein n=1 Tax=Arthrobacter sp. TB 23 TaxID=494419 RepID=UPI00031B1083|nr:glycosyltransferase family 2 protein [Arthrobacter sp. TB 23]